ncbi:MAG: DUF805 domain-containing protein [Phenylobacterium sp.]|uniref:DUF805 domain-containing protein n=1 Tax=Phenylobacterium sp. TaxID=1871053 RepID=UPI002724A5F8|nr:DUF805 domain-containing protein [Phenylobacterium sp.]MDO9431102.1 DUF805 domain-containing protein [Phenylobacterium sp.]
MELMFQPIRKYADFSGRARRKEFWLFALLVLLIEIVFMALLSAVGGQDLLMGYPASANVPMNGAVMAVALAHFAVMLALLVPSLAVTFRRLHDTNRKGWWILISFIPLIGALVLFVFYLLDGTPGPNRFGPDPKQRSELQPS